MAGLMRRGENTSQQRSSRVRKSSGMQVLGHVTAGEHKGKRFLKASLHHQLEKYAMDPTLPYSVGIYI